MFDNNEYRANVVGSSVTIELRNVTFQVTHFKMMP